MTREEAIKRLEEAKEAWDRWVPNNGSPASKLSEAAGMAISALREQEERSKGCWACYLPVMRGRLRQELRQVLGVNPLLCPMCGRELEVDVDVEA